MSDRPQRFSRPAFGASDAGHADAQSEDSTILRRNLRDAGEPVRPRGTAPPTYDDPRLTRHATGPRATDESVWARGSGAPAAPASQPPAGPASQPPTVIQRSAPPTPRPNRRPTSLSPASATPLAAAPASAATTSLPTVTPGPTQRDPGRDDPAADLLDRYPEQPRPAPRHRVQADGATLEVPLPGHRLGDARRAAVTARAVAATVLVLGLAGLAVTGGFLATMATRGTSGTVAPSSQTPYNTAAAQAFGAQYLRTCLARPRGDDRAEQARVDQLRAMNVGPFDEACRSNSADTRARAVGAITFTGITQAVADVPQARYLGFMVELDRATTRYVVPVYLDEPGQGLGPSVIGRIGVTPAEGYGVPTSDATPTTADNDLGASLRSEFLPQFMTAWAASSASLEQFLSSTHSEAAAAGLGGAVKDVQVTDVVARPRKPVAPGQKIEYADGDQVDVTVATTSTLTAGAQPQPSSYRLVLERAGGKWFVRDAQGGVAEVPSGVPSAPKSARPTRTPR